VVQIEVEWIARIHVDQHHIRIAHRQFAEAKLVAAVRHIVCERHVHVGRCSRMTENLDQFATIEANRCDFSGDVGRRKQFRRIENQVVLLGLDSLHFPGLDQIRNPSDL
jgi:hypothetical protein